MTTQPTPASAVSEIASRFVASTETARDRFAHYTRSVSFSLGLGVREIRLIAGRPWDPDKSMEHADVASLQRLFDKGLIEADPTDRRPRLTEAGKLVRQLLILSKHIEPHSVWTNPMDVLRLLQHSASWASTDGTGYVMKHVEMRDIDNEPHLVVRLNEGLGNYSEWAVPRSAVKRIG